MRREKKPVGRWIGEAILIFLSVYGAFYLENRREKRSEEEVYVRHLKDFKRDLQQNQGKFNWELKKVGQGPGEGYIQGNTIKYTFFDSLFSNQSRTNADSIMSIINDNGIFGVTPWIFESPQYEKLNSQYYSFIRNDSLRQQIQMHHRDNQSRIEAKDDINNYVTAFKAIEDKLNHSQGGLAANRAILFSNESVNTIRRIKRGYATLRGMTENNRTNDSLLIIQVNHELALWGEDN